MDGVAGASAGLRPPGWHRHMAKLGDNPGVLIHKGKAPPRLAAEGPWGRRCHGAMPSPVVVVTPWVGLVAV